MQHQQYERPTNQLEELLKSFYTLYNQPDKLSTIPLVLERYQGREDLLVTNLLDKYGISRQQLVLDFPEHDIGKLFMSEAERGKISNRTPLSIVSTAVKSKSDLVSDTRKYNGDDFSVPIIALENGKERELGLTGSFNSASADNEDSRVAQVALTRFSSYQHHSNIDEKSNTIRVENDLSHGKIGGQNIDKRADLSPVLNVDTTISSESTGMIMKLKESPRVPACTTSNSHLSDLARLDRYRNRSISNQIYDTMSSDSESSNAEKFAEAGRTGDPPSRLQQHAMSMISDLESEVQQLSKYLAQLQSKLVTAEEALVKKTTELQYERGEREKDKSNMIQQFMDHRTGMISSNLSCHDDRGTKYESCGSSKSKSLTPLSVILSATESVTILNTLEEENKKLRSELTFTRELNDTKHKQLLKVINMNHKLGAQVRFLSARAFDSYDTRERYNRILGKNADSLPDFILHESDFLKRQVLSAVATRRVDTRTALSKDREEMSHETGAENVVSFVPEATKTKAVWTNLVLSNLDEGDTKADVVALSSAFEVLYSSWVGNRVELKHALQEADVAVTRVQELQSQLVQLQHMVSLPAELAPLHMCESSSDGDKQNIQEDTSYRVSNYHAGRIKSSEDGGNAIEDRQHNINQLCVMLDKSRRDQALAETACTLAKEKATFLGHEVIALREQLQRAQDNVTANQASMANLVELSRKQIRQAEERAFGALRTSIQRMAKERDGFLSKVRSIEELDRSLRLLHKRKESEEMRQWRRRAHESGIESTKSAKEVKFLQSQLVEAAKYILEISNDVLGEPSSRQWIRGDET